MSVVWPGSVCGTLGGAEPPDVTGNNGAGAAGATAAEPTGCGAAGSKLAGAE